MFGLCTDKVIMAAVGANMRQLARDSKPYETSLSVRRDGVAAERGVERLRYGLVNAARFNRLGEAIVTFGSKQPLSRDGSVLQTNIASEALMHDNG